MEKKINDIYEKKFNDINNYFNPKRKYKIEFIDKDTILFLNEKNKKIIKAKYNFYGILNESNQFIWNTSIPLINSKQKENVKKIRKQKDVFYKQYIDNMDELSYLYYNILDNDITLIDDNSVDKVNKLIMYLTDDLFIFNPISSKNSIQFLTINKVLEVFT